MRHMSAAHEASQESKGALNEPAVGVVDAWWTAAVDTHHPPDFVHGSFSVHLAVFFCSLFPSLSSNFSFIPSVACFFGGRKRGIFPISSTEGSEVDGDEVRGGLQEPREGLWRESKLGRPASQSTDKVQSG
ncbi:uncharacterized protein SPSK_10028 [Sporothrix schenckii 1099-18]|uniref:Uncharacterized protein n=1 Tax=Sporothrix schenckii 1099-18 TaxID=1397361 RepID=A0A0F2M8E9_SPOSC|nr:uncharacterized protein SPSK_10028 [Sporothrix schenckii 1099-18]KJR85927.1 hypothetical protein SPSK_10028 [Sporothrix schenckii 1099-18]